MLLSIHLTTTIHVFHSLLRNHPLIYTHRVYETNKFYKYKIQYASKYYMYNREVGDFNFRIHLYTGIILWVLAFQADVFLNPVTVLIGAILPDADHRKSLQGAILPLWRLFKHRTFIHSMWSLILFSAITALLWNPWAGFSLGLGYASHLFMDSCTPMGIRWWNFGGKRKRPSAKGKRS